MPKMPKALQKTVGDADPISGSFEPLPPGRYVATLAKVEAKNSASGNTMWVWEFDSLHDMDGNKKPGRQWYNTMVPQSKAPANLDADALKKWETGQRLSAGRLRAIFEAFGYTLDSDTDEMLGERVVLQIGIETISKGPKTGERTNRVNGVFSAEDVDFDSDEDDADEY